MNQTEYVGYVTKGRQKSGAKMKKRRTEKTMRRSFIYMRKAPKIRCFFWQGLYNQLNA